jgi:hypothetical protein
VNIKDILKQLERIRQKRLCRVEIKNGRISLEKQLPRNACGFYWIYTSYSYSDLKNSSKPQIMGAINLSSLVTCHENLRYICNIKQENYLLVYNGIGGSGEKGYGGLRERIIEEFRGGKGTGALAIKHTDVNDLSKWRYSYAIVNCPDDSDLVDLNIDYHELSRWLERAWRIEYGWPILCKS